MAQHTPGPWKFGHVGTDALWIGPSYDQTPVAHVDHDMEYARENSRANARLIAAAPDLLEALTALADQAGKQVAAIKNGGSLAPFDVPAAIDVARAAIAKATTA